jgi:hypothetical protein
VQIQGLLYQSQNLKNRFSLYQDRFLFLKHRVDSG